MVSAAGQAAAIPLKRSDYDKRIQDDVLTLLLRKINESKDSSSILLKYQRFRELLSENKTGQINQFIDHFTKEITELKVPQKKSTQQRSPMKIQKENDFVNSKNFKRLFPKAEVLFEFSEYGVAARDILREHIAGGRKRDMQFLPTTTFFRTQSHFKGILVEQYSDVSFDGFKGLKLDFYY